MRNRFKKLVKFLFCFSLCFSLVFFNSFSASAASTTLRFYDTSYKAYANGLSGSNKIDITNKVTKTYYSSGQYTLFNFPKYDDVGATGLALKLDSGFNVNLYPGKSYSFSFRYVQRFNSMAWVKLSVYYYTGNNPYSSSDWVEGENLFIYSLYELNDSGSSWHDVNGTFTVPTFNSSFYCAFVLEYISNDVVGSSSNQWIALGDFTYSLYDPYLNPGTYDPPTSNSWEDSKDEFSSVEAEMPTLADGDLSDVDLSNFSKGFACINSIFDKLLTKTNLSVVLVFSLTFGLGIYLIGRKVGG
ncbi:MAG: hypothetical protein ACI4KI_06200 [Candidatus Fimenecus sp.]